MQTARHLAAWLIFLALGPSVWGGDWPTYMHDNTRSGVTAAGVELPLVEHWAYRSPVEPRPAWPLPQPGWTELPKVDFDDAFYTVADRDRVYFGSSVDNTVHALDAATGIEAWDFVTSGPIRLAPSLADGRVYVSSDDGKVYCLKQQDGTEAWSHDAAPDPRRVLGNGRVTSLWPVRTGVVVEGGRAFFGAGVFPYHRVFVTAVDAADGKPIWKQDDVRVFGGFSPQGYMLTAGDGLIVPSGRATPACLDRATGKLKFEVPHPGNKGEAAGVYGVVVDKTLYVGMQNTLFGINTDSGTAHAKWASAAKLVATPDHYFLL
jgi:outer membrane protein assembly factor BamB